MLFHEKSLAGYIDKAFLMAQTFLRK